MTGTVIKNGSLEGRPLQRGDMLSVYHDLDGIEIVDLLEVVEVDGVLFGVDMDTSIPLEGMRAQLVRAVPRTGVEL